MQLGSVTTAAAKQVHKGDDQQAPATDLLSSTTPDVPNTASHRLPWFKSIAAPAAVLGATVGALSLLSKNRSMGSVLSSLRMGAIVGGVLGGAAAVADRATDGQVSKQLKLVTLDRRAQGMFVLKNVSKPWLGPLALEVASDARAAQDRTFRDFDPRDGAPDGYRHTYAAALMTLRMIRDHELEPGDARTLAVQAGDAHERDGQDNNDHFARSMDDANNRAGAELIGSGKASDGSWLRDGEVHGLVLEALADGKITIVDRAASPNVLRLSNTQDLPTT